MPFASTALVNGSLIIAWHAPSHSNKTMEDYSTGGLPHWVASQRSNAQVGGLRRKALRNVGLKALPA